MSVITTSPPSKAINPDTLPKIYCNLEGFNAVVKDIALNSLIELAAGLSITGLTCFFVAKPTIPTVFIIAISVVAFNTLIRAFIVVVKRSELFDKMPATYKNLELLILNLASSLTFTLLDLRTRWILVHEGGHFLAAHLVYQNARPSIEIFPLKSEGATKHFPGALSKIGNIFGKTNSDLFVTIGGPLAGSLLALTDLGIAHYVKDSHRELRSYLITTAIANVAGHAIYAISALWMNKPGHDFVKIWKVGGIHPITATVAIIALPAIFQAGLMFFEKPKE